MPNYDVGNILVKIESKANSTIQTVDTLIDKMKALNREIKSINKTLDKKINKIDGKKLNVSTPKIFDSKNITNKVFDKSQLANYNNELKKTTTHTKNISNNLLNLGKIYFLINYFKRIGIAIGNIASETINFNETLNKFQVSMGRNYAESLKFVNSITTAFNLSTESIMDYMATFNNMLSALGQLDADVSYRLSETLTQMAIDYASLFNVSIETAMSQFESALAGQVRSIRSTSGFDITERTLFGIYQELGGTKTMRQLSQLEKRMLIILAIQKQMVETGAIGDFQATINQASNQLKQIQETIKEVSRWAGQLMLKWLAPMIEQILAGTIALREMLKSLNLLKGYVLPDIGTNRDANDYLEETEDNIEGITDSVEELKRSLLGFDKLNILGGNSSSVLGEDFGILAEKIREYNSSLTKTKNTANELAKKILTWLGYTQQIHTMTLESGEVIQETIWKLNEGNTNLSKILNTIISIGAFILSLGIVKKLEGVFALLSESKILGVVKEIATKLNVWIVIITLIITSFADLYRKNEEFNASVNESFKRIIENVGIIFDNIKKIWEEISSTDLFNYLKNVLGYAGKVLVDILDIVTSLFAFNWEGLGDAFLKLGEDLWNGIIGNLAFAFNEVLTWAVEVFKKLGEYVTELFTNIWNNITLAFTKAWEAVKESIYNVVIKPIGNFFIGMINKIIKALNKISVDIPDWVPGIGGKKFGFNIKNIPELANGGVVTRPTMAMIGEYSGANSNPEIVSPENKMREVFVESMLPLVQAVVNGDQQVISAINGLANRPIEMNGRKVSEAIYNDLQNVATRKGQMMFAK